MIRKLSQYLLVVLIFAYSSVNGQGWLRAYFKSTNQAPESKDLNYYDVRQWAEQHFAEVEAEIKQRQAKGEIVHEGDGKRFAHYIKYKRWEWYWSSRIHQDGTLGYPSFEATRRKSDPGRNRKEGDVWTRIGFTSNSGGYWGMGRAECMGFHPTDINTFYVGSRSGGLWKTTNGGSTYTALGDHLPISQIAAINVDFNNPNTVYIALGPRGGWWNRSMGVYKSTDGGTNFSPTSFAYDYADGEPIYDMIMSETNSSILLVARGDGIYRTSDGGNNWNKVANNTFNDLAWKPGSSNVVYAARDDYWGSSEVYKSTDAGQSWNQITNISVSQNSLRLAVTPANPSVIAYWSNAQNKAVYVSTNEGASFGYRGDTQHGMFPLFISPNNENILYNGGINVDRSTDGGVNWFQQTQWHSSATYPEVHADFRNMYHSPVDHDLLFFCNDGGVYSYRESTENWTELTAGLVITEYYRLAVAQSDPEITICGSQDNGGSLRRSNTTWKNTNGGDAMEQQIDPNNADIMYTTYINGQLYRSMDGWTFDTYNDISANIPGGKPSGDWVAPYVLDPNNSSVIVAGYDDVWRSTDRGDSWTKISNNLAGGNLHNVAVAPSNSNIIYVSRNATLYRTDNLGGTWNSYSTPGGEKITRIAVHETNPDRIWITRGGWSNGQKVYYSSNGGQSWTNISGSLPNIITNCIILANTSDDAMYIGTDIGVYYRDNTLTDWIEYRDGLPNVKVNDLDIQFNTGVIRAATWGRGCWEAPLLVIGSPDCNGDLGGTASIDLCNVCSGGNTGIAPNSTCSDCNGDPNGTASIDLCGECSGGNTGIAPNSTCLDCHGDINGTASVDQCGDCSGGNTGVTPNEACSDCNGDPNGTATVDACGVCSGGNTGITPNSTCEDCNGDPNGTASVDLCGVCSGGNTGVTPNTTCLDCNGEINGTASIDQCGNCSGGNTGIVPNEECSDCNGEPHGTASIDLCGDCTGGSTGLTPNASCTDCNGEVNGSASIDQCGNCSGGTTGVTPNEACSDCNGEPNGTASIDQCGDCSGGSTGIIPNEACSDCNGDPNGTASIDLCGNCSGGNTGVSPCYIPDFEADFEKQCLGKTVVFADKSQAVPPGLTYSWSFGDGASPGVHSGQGPISVEYSTTGFKTITLDISGEVETKIDYVFIGDQPGNITISGNQSVDCFTESESYSVVGEFNSTFNWTANEATIMTGQGGSSIAVDFELEDAILTVVEVTEANCFGNTSVLYIDVCGITNIQSNTSNSLRVYPNPTYGVLYIDGWFDEGWKLFNLLGTQVLQGDNNTVDMSGLASGLYVLKISNAVFTIKKQ